MGNAELEGSLLLIGRILIHVPFDALALGVRLNDVLSRLVAELRVLQLIHELECLLDR